MVWDVPGEEAATGFWFQVQTARVGRGVGGPLGFAPHCLHDLGPCAAPSLSFLICREGAGGCLMFPMRLLGARAGEALGRGHGSARQRIPVLCQDQYSREVGGGGL